MRSMHDEEELGGQSAADINIIQKVPQVREYVMRMLPLKKINITK